MRHVNLPEKNYKSFDELIEYAKKRAQISAARRGHQEFHYWFEVMEWAAEPWVREKDPLLVLLSALHDIEHAAPNDIRRLAQSHARAVHCRIILRNCGRKSPRLSLKWLRDASERITGKP